MNKKNMKIILPLMIFLILCAGNILPQSAISLIKDQLIKKQEICQNKFPVYTVDGKWTFNESINWLSGFLGGELWNLYEITDDEKLKELALKHADWLIQYAGIDNTHDMGFIFYPTVVRAFKETGDPKYRDSAIKAAEMLLKRFNTNGNFIRAWGKLNTADRAGWMIIDTMMNLELLFWASEVTGNREFYSAAYKHAITTMNQHVRNDYSSYHVVEFDVNSGEVIKKRTHQGYGDETTWARGQAWGIHGFAIAYKYTGDERFLNIAVKMADYMIDRLPDDFVPYWDLDLKDEGTIRDASAAAIAAGGFFLISELTELKKDYDRFLGYALKISDSLLENYLFTKSSRKVEEGILLHTVYNFAKDWGKDESFPCGDYYFTETLRKSIVHRKKEKLFEDKLKRQSFPLNDNWFYLEDNIDKPEKLYQSVKEWQKINLPHTWNKFDAVDSQPGYRRGVGWYRKDLYMPALDKNTSVKICFEGVNTYSEVYVNGKIAGGHIGGYLQFDVDITRLLKQSDYNTILVKADNSYNPDIPPSQTSDFVIYGGITRDVHLKILPGTYIDKMQVNISNVSVKSAATGIKIFLKNKAMNNFLTIKILLKNNKNKTVAETQKKIKIQEESAELSLALPELKNPELWSVDNPYLYSVEAILTDGKKVIDSFSERIGYRWFEFRENGPFYLNGKRVLLRGTHRHEDYAGLGNALPDSLHRKDMKMIKEMGANFVRLAHYPQDPEVYRACDELGLLVWDEIPWCRGGMGKEIWKRNVKSYLDEMIDQNYNHPSIIIWSLGNEIYWLPEFPDGDNNDSLRSFLKELNDIAHQKDPARYTAVRKYYEGSDIVDLFSPSIWSGWYSGVYKGYEKAIVDAQKKYKRFFHAEFGGDSHVGRHSELPVTGDGFASPDEWEEKVNQVKISNIANMGDWSESYMVDLFDWYLRYSEQSSSFSGSAQWAFKDFPTPLRPENPIPYMNQKGLLDRNGNPKDAYYVFKSYWNTKDKFCYIESPSGTERSGPKDLKRDVNVFSNCSEVELFLNDVSQGRLKKDITKFPASGLSWSVNFSSGKNILKAVGFCEIGKSAEHQFEVNYSYEKHGTADKIILSYERLKNGNYLITATAVDINGNRALDYNRRIYFSSLGSGELLQNLGTPTGSSVIEMANGKAVIEFKPVPSEEAVIEARNQDFKGSYLKFIGE
ncbi:MAG TPA: glycoside hydrolase family 2 TIM barrel-domain containing protein [Melioribacteraceae bacterium]|nr:glycoside hydrolase family 2 TIM barrel-domain containing protein [Melioribacteraceae bacterium]